MKMQMSREIFKACRILFGPDINLSVDFLYYIQTSGIKSAFRKRARETHPDLRAGLEPKGSAAESPEAASFAASFTEAHWAYRRLIDFIGSRDSHHGRRHPPLRMSGAVVQPGRHRPRRRTRKSAHGGPGPAGHDSGRPGGYYYKSPMPRRRLLFGEYLFYGGYVPWEALIKAIVWQRSQRPRFGDLAEKGGLLSEDLVLHGFRQRRLGEPIGQSLRRLGLLSDGQLNSLIARQRGLQRPIGEFFVINGYLTASGLNAHIEGHRKHNKKNT